MSVKKKIVKRKLGDKEIEGTLLVENGKYIYDYPENRRFEQNLFNADKHKISKKLNLSREYVYAVLKGIKFNEQVLLEAEKLGKYNVEFGFINN